MRESKLIEIEGIGPVRFTVNRRARRLRLCYSLREGVGVTVPRGLSLEKAEGFVKARKDWIERRRRELEALRAECIPLLSDDGDGNGAARKIIERLEALAARHGFTYNRVTVRSQRTRWGSCSEANNLSLNVNLARLPSELMDYVLLHELVHTRVKNHGRAFWDELEKYVPEARVRAAQLQKLGMILL